MTRSDSDDKSVLLVNAYLDGELDPANALGVTQQIDKEPALASEAERIKALMFTFEDLGKLDPGSIQTLLRHVEKDKLGLALKGATDGLRDVFFSNMSERAGKILRDDMEAMGPVRLKDVDEAQMRMVNIAKDLANKGEIMIAGGSGEDELVY